MKRQSKKAAAITRSRTAIRLELLSQRGPYCQACDVTPVGQQTGEPRQWTDMHEILTRARGGDPTDPENILCVCRACHYWITTHETAARELGLVRGRTAEEHQERFRI